ncbi:MAG: heat-inducible transcriptional repressor HrcA [Acidobacteriota bacterium]
MAESRDISPGAPPRAVSSAASLLSERDRAILKDVIVTYILRAEPVSSRAIAKHSQHGLSAASIRNVMADLEEHGYLSQPHTSAGRVPTPKAYHLYIGSMMDGAEVASAERQIIDEALSDTRDADELVASASSLLSDLSHHVGIALTPALDQTKLRTISFVPLTDTKVLCVVVSDAGFVDNKVIQTRERVSRRELVRISNYVNEHFSGRTLQQIRERLLTLLDEERARMDQMLGLTIRLASAGLAMGDLPTLLLDGTTEVLRQPELADLERVRRLLETFADKAQLVYILTELMRGKGVRVLIGEDSDLTSELDFSLVAAPYGVGDTTLGTLGIFGPSRMQYQRTIPLVHYLGERLSDALANTFEVEA